MRAPALPPPMQTTRRRSRRGRSLLLGFLGLAFTAGVVLFLIGSSVVGYLLYKASQDLPSYASLANYEPPVMTRIHANNGALISEYARERRIFVPIQTIPKLVVGAYLSAEDKRFYEHPGVDYIGVARAIVKNVKAPGRRPEGASTITQQVAKNFLLSSEQSYMRKIKEAILAFRIEGAYSKDRILELYLNEIFLGIGSYGVAAASLNYFNKELKDLEPHEAAYLAALPKGPNNYHPFRAKTRDAAIARRNWILGEMALNGYITEAQAEEARKKPLGVNLRPFGAHIFAAEFFAEEVRRALLAQYGEDKLYGGGMSVRTTLDPNLQQFARQALIDGLVKFDRERGWRGAVNQIEVSASADWGATLGGFDVATDVSPWRLGVVLDVQKTKITVGLRPNRNPDGKISEEREGVEIQFDEMKWAGRFVATDKSKGAAPRQPSDVVKVGDVIWVAPKDAANPAGAWTLHQIPEVGGGLVAMDPHTGRVLAVVGGFSFAISQFDRALQAKRQPGSSFKPLVYAAALDNGYKPTSIVLDAPIEIEQAGQETWRPENYNKSGSIGPATLRVGIELSKNQMTARLGQDLGLPLIVEYSRRFGVYDELLPVPAVVLGSYETTLLKMTAAYGMLANGGKEIKPTLIDRIQDRRGRTIWRHDTRVCTDCKATKWTGQEEPELADDRRQIIDPHTAYQMTSILQGVVERGTAVVVREMLPGFELAGKTGTTNDSKDTWFVGYSPDLVAGVYIGYDTPRPMGKTATGGAVSAPVFGSFMKMALKGTKSVPFRRPPGIKMVRINRVTGLRAISSDKNTIWEAFKPYEEPDDPSSMLGYDGGQSAAVSDPSTTRGLY